MRYGIFSDVHSNLEALNAVVEAYKNEEIDRYLCVGDVVGYAANPGECIQIVKELSYVCVAGNHDWAVVGKLSLEYFNPFAKEAIVWTSPILGPSGVEYLAELPLIYQEENFCLVHGTLDIPQEFYYLDNYESGLKTFANLKKQLCFVGHTHKPGVFVQVDNQIYFEYLSELKIQEDKRYIINAGSVGQPRDGNPFASYGIYDTDKKLVELKRLNYDVRVTRDKIYAAGLPKFLGDRLLIGR